MRKQTDGTATHADLAVLAGSCGLVSNDDHGRQAFRSWLANDPKAARKALFTRVAARRAAASAAQATTKKYPAGWLRAAGVRPAKPKASVPNGTRITEARD